MTPGKRWEQNIKDSLGKMCVRLYDTTNGFSGIKNPCDFIYYTYPNIVYIEAKSTQGKRLSFSNITDNQLTELDYFSTQQGVVAGVAIEFRDYKEGYFVPIQLIHKIIQSGKKSIDLDTCRTNISITNMGLNYAKVNCKFDSDKFNKELKVRAEYEIKINS